MKAICGRGRTLLRRSGALSAAVAAGALCVLALAGPASAAGAGAVSFTQHLSNVVVDQEATANPCTGASGTLTQIADNAVAHITILTSGPGAGTFWATFTATGTASFVPDDPSQPSYTGKFTIWDGENGNLKNQVATFTGTFHHRHGRIHRPAPRHVPHERERQRHRRHLLRQARAHLRLAKADEKPGGGLTPPPAPGDSRSPRAWPSRCAGDPATKTRHARSRTLSSSAAG